MIRLFVAVPLPTELRRRLAGLCHGVRDARWVAEENLHLTLRFIGEVEEPRAEEIVDALQNVDHAPFSLTLAGVGHFESRRKVRSIWAGIDPCEALMSLQERVDAALRRAGLPPDGRRFSPHVTLARLKAASSRHVGPWLEAKALFRAEPLAVGQFVLFDSFLAHTGAIYTPVETFSLGNDEAV